MADPRASVKTVPRERLEGKTPRDAFALVGNIIAEFQASFRACYQHDRWISPSLSFSLMTLAATLVVDQVTNRIYRVECSFHDRQKTTQSVSRFHLSAYIISHCALRRLISRTHTPLPLLPQIISISLECRAIVSESSYVSDGRASSARGYNR